MIYPHVMGKGVAGVRSPLDLLDELAGDDVQAAMDATRGLNDGARIGSNDGTIVFTRKG